MEWLVEMELCLLKDWFIAPNQTNSFNTKIQNKAQFSETKHISNIENK